MALSSGRGISIWHVIPSVEMVGLVRPYRAYGYHRFGNPGRCPGLIYYALLGRLGCPFGAVFVIRHFLVFSGLPANRSFQLLRPNGASYNNPEHRSGVATDIHF